METKIQSKDIVKKWVKAYSSELYQWACYKTSDNETARDIVQETFLAAVRYVDKFEEKSSAKTWLFSILNNKISDHHRKKFRQIVLNESELIKDKEISFFSEKGKWKESSTPSSWSADEENLLDNQEFRKTLTNCLENLPPSWKSIVRMKYISDIEGEKICQETGISKTNYWQILHRAKLQLRKCLEANWFKS